jgi:hypothetical protein
MKLIVGRILSALFTAGGWLLAGARTVLDLIGYSTAPEDVGVAQARLDQFLGWLLSVPWWAVWGFALVSTMWFIWVSWPRQGTETSAPMQRNVNRPDNRLDAVTQPAKPTRSMNDDSAQTMANIDRFLNECFLPAHTSLREGVEKFSLGLLDKTTHSTSLMLLLRRDYEIMTSAITRARYSKPPVDMILDLIDTCFDHYWIVLCVIENRKDHFSPEAEIQHRKISAGTRKLLLGIRSLVAMTPAISGVGRVQRFTDQIIESLIAARDEKPV